MEGRIKHKFALFASSMLVALLGSQADAHALTNLAQIESMNPEELNLAEVVGLL